MMHTYKEALQLVLSNVPPLKTEVVSISKSLDLVSAEDIVSKINIPYCDNSAMDGFAIIANDCIGASDKCPIFIKIIGNLKAGCNLLPVLESGNAYRIMTGACVPFGADVVLPLENVKLADEYLIITSQQPKLANIRLSGEDVKKGMLVISNGSLIRSAEIGVLASIGQKYVSVYKRPLVAVITTGDELVDLNRELSVGQIYDANIYTLCSQINKVGAISIPFPRIPDEKNLLKEVLNKAISEADIILLNGGVSVGDFDYSKVILSEIGARQIFWRVAQKPGGPLGLWAVDNKLIFGIPGNPVAAMLMVEEYVRPLLRKMMGFKFLHRPEKTCIMDDIWHKRQIDCRLHFIRLKAKQGDNGCHVTLTGNQGSGLLSSMLYTDVVALVPANVNCIKTGDSILVHCINDPEDH